MIHFIKICFEQQIYARQIFFTQPLVVIVETFRRSGCEVASECSLLIRSGLLKAT